MLNTILLVREYGKHAQCAAGTVESPGSLYGHLPVRMRSVRSMNASVHVGRSNPPLCTTYTTRSCIAVGGSCEITLLLCRAAI
jgi:hypothetical protein